MNNTALKIFGCYTGTAVLITMILLGINFFGFVLLGSDGINQRASSPVAVLEQVGKNLEQTQDGFSLRNREIIPPGSWCILLDEGGRVVWEQNKPEEIPDRYSINDIAQMTRWFLKDYPVYVQAEDYGLLVLGSPKNAVGKYSVEYSMDWFDTLPRRVGMILLINLCLAAVLACLFGLWIYRNLKTLTGGIRDLRQERLVRLKERGLFKELAKSMNETSETIARKNQALCARDSARSNWIAGISHDIRTPLSMVMGYGESLERCGELSEENRKKAGIIAGQGMKIKKLIEDLNLISSLEYDMQPARKKPVKICPLLRGVTSELMNSGLPDRYRIELDLQEEKATILGDGALLERAFFNLISNSIVHNEQGCTIQVSEYVKNGSVHIRIWDNGTGVEERVIENIAEIPKAAHGLGLPMAYKIFYVHGGRLEAANDHGFSVTAELPLA